MSNTPMIHPDDELTFDGASLMGEEIPCNQDMLLVHQYARIENKRLAEQAEPQRTYVALPKVEVCDIPGGDDDSETEDEDIVKKWCTTSAPQNIVSKEGPDETGDGFLSDDDMEVDVDIKQGRNAIRSEADMIPLKTEPERSPVIDVIYPEVVAATDRIQAVGSVKAIVEGTVVVEGDEGSRALDLQSLVCLENRSVLGVIVDTFGAIRKPHYLVYITSPQSLKETVGELTDLVGKKVCAVLEECTFAIEEDNLAKALAGLDFMEPIDDLDDPSTDEENEMLEDESQIPDATVDWLRSMGCPEEFL